MDKIIALLRRGWHITSLHYNVDAEGCYAEGYYIRAEHDSQERGTDVTVFGKTLSTAVEELYKVAYPLTPEWYVKQLVERSTK